MYSIIDNSYIQQSASKAYLNLCPGVFVTTGDSVSSVVDSYIDGDLDFTSALQKFNETLNNSLINSSSDADKQFIISLAQFELDRLVTSSNNKSIQNVQNSVTNSFNQNIYNYVSGSESLEDTLSDLDSNYSSALSSAESPVQGILVNTSYLISLKKLEMQARQKAYQKLDSAVSDEQLSEADDYYQSEEDLIDMFEVAEFESALNFQLWFNTLPPSETIEYKKFFDFLLNDSSIRMFLVVPISLILVRILLGTRLVLSRGGHYSAKGDE